METAAAVRTRSRLTCGLPRPVRPVRGSRTRSTGSASWTSMSRASLSASTRPGSSAPPPASTRRVTVACRPAEVRYVKEVRSSLISGRMACWTISATSGSSSSHSPVRRLSVSAAPRLVFNRFANCSVTSAPPRGIVRTISGSPSWWTIRLVAYAPMSTIASTCSSSRAVARSSAKEARSTPVTRSPARSQARTAVSTASLGAAIIRPRTVGLPPGSSSGVKSSSAWSSGSGSSSRTWNGSDLRSSRRGRLATAISRTTIWVLVTPSTTSRVRKRNVDQSWRSWSVTTRSFWMTPPRTTPRGSITWPNFVITGPSLLRPVSTARIDIEPMSSPIGVTAAMSRSLRSGGRYEQGPVPGRDRAGEEHRDQGTGQHRGTERQRGPPPRAPGEQQHGAGQAAEQEAGEGADPYLCPAQPAQVQAEQAGELDVAEAHPARVQEGDREVAHEQQRHPGQPAQRGGPLPAGRAGRQQERPGHRVRGQHDRVGQPLDRQVDHRQGHRDGGQVEVRRQRRGQAEPQGHRHEQCRGQQLDQWVPGADRGTAGRAPATQHQPTQQGYVVPRPDPGAAVRAARPRPAYRLVPRDPVDHHVEERADRQPDYPDPGGYDPRVHERASQLPLVVQLARLDAVLLTPVPLELL